MYTVQGQSARRKTPRSSKMKRGRRFYDQAVAQKRLRTRRTSRAHSAVASRIAALLLAAALLASLAVMFGSDSYYVYEIGVQGSFLVSPRQILDQTQIEGYNVFFIDPRAAEERIEALPDIRDAAVQLGLPNRMVVVVRERQARVVWRVGDQRFGVDEEGLIVSLGGQDEPEVVITSLDSPPTQPGDQVDLQPVAAAEEYRDLLPGATNFEYSAQNGLSYRNEHGWQVYLGDGDNAALKAAILQALVLKLTTQGATVESIDVRCPESPLYRLAEGSSPQS
ncbi:MAG: FtsQ-type POTRA domain-containing protein [Anaerolineae bacterium]|nr:FtsQ-type POTRA domain-containing protein [Anaerolineae bacterium]